VLVGLNPDQHAHRLRVQSGSQRPRALNRKLMFCDERVSAVDVSTQSLILNPLMQLQNELSLSYLFTAYDLLVVRHTSGRTAVMYRGVVVEEGIAEEIFAYPVHPYMHRGYMVRDPGAGFNVARQTLSHHS
jgi:ABC-type oligopeptide transport system ATPase subunit